MSKSGTIENRSTAESLRAWRREVEQWRASLQHFLAETLDELRGLTKVIESDVTAVTAAPEPARVARQAATPQAPPVRPANQTPKPPPISRSEPVRPPVAAPRHEDNAGRVTEQPVNKSATGVAPEDRLAQLARRLEEKLERSGSRTSNE